jgi:hypothetical protein
MYHFTLKFVNKYVGGMTVGYTLNVSSPQSPPAPSDIEKALINAGFSKPEARHLSEPTYWKWEETVQGGDNIMSKPTVSSNSKGNVQDKVAKEDSDDDDDEPSDWSCMSFLEKVEYIVKFKWIDDFLDNLPKRIFNAILSFLFMEIMVVVWLLASLCSESWRNAVWKAIYNSVKWFNRLLDKSNIVS